jgi:4-diphosphocytidyl-2-C-methyl-D-erythritol kinase
MMQTIDLCDVVRISHAGVLELSVGGDETRSVPREGPRNLAFAAAQALAAHAGDAELGAHIELEKQIPAGIGLGGGSADAAAVLRGLNQLWGLGLPVHRLCEIGASIGSDVPFCVAGGAALVTGRGENVDLLPDGAGLELTLFLPDLEVEDKTRRMYAGITPADYRSGNKARVLAETVRRGLPLASSDFVNAFDARLRAEVEPVEKAMSLCGSAGLAVFACGSGPGFFSPTPFEALPPLLARELEHDWGVRAIACRTLGRAAATAIREV